MKTTKFLLAINKMMLTAGILTGLVFTCKENTIQAQVTKTQNEIPAAIDTLNHNDVINAYVFALYRKCGNNRAKTIALIRKHMNIEINRIRKEKGLPPITENRAIVTISQKHAEDMLARKYYSHWSPDGKSPDTRAREAGLSHKYIVENIDKGSVTIQQVINEMRMRSKLHKQNILEPYVTDIGAGISFGEYNDIISIHWVLMLAKLKKTE